MILTTGLMRNAKVMPEKEAIVDGDHRFTYAEFASRVAKLKEALAHAGVQKGDRVAALMLNDFRYIELMFGVTALGAILVPLNYRLSPDELVSILNDSGAKALFVHREFLKTLPYLKEYVPSLTHYVLADNDLRHEELDSYEAWIAQASDTPLSYSPDIHENDVAGLFYTGGTTGRSKGVMLTHRNMVSNFYHTGVLTGLNRNSRYLHVAPMFHLADGASMVSITIVGGTHCVVRSFTTKAFMQAIDQYKVTSTLLVPTMLNMVMNDPDFKKYDVSSLERVTYGAAPMPVALLKRVIMEFPGIQLVQGYGMTEASPSLTQLAAEYHVVGGTEKEERRLLSAGKPVLGVEVRVVDEEGNEVPTGQVGEVIARGDNIMKGYWNLPDETNAVLKNGWYHTGDMGAFDDEYFLYIVDRKKDMIISGGENIYSPEVENILYQHPEVVEVAVVGAPDPKWGEAVVAVVVKTAGSALTEQELIDFTRGRLANYKVPKRISFVDELPKSGAGKILKRNLRDRYWEGMSRRVN
ncbi:MAG: acyl-CoA synthetase (AMP-forming)/AMP-acid ligase [Brevibacillus sp.]|nr:acyl-CoA synthetase (AMP-forming)/AMP-acid ligase [Brevibacillus sp.]